MKLSILAAATVTGLTASAAASAHEAGGPDLTRLPLGDGKISTGPKRGYVWACASKLRVTEAALKAALGVP